MIPDWDAFVAACRRPEPTVFRTRTGRVPAAALAARLEAQGFRLSPLEGMPDFFQVEAEPYPISSTLEHWMGLLYVQQASTGVAAPVLAPEPGERVLDLCAAPGGKTCHAAELMEDRGALVAADVSEPRIRGLLGNVYRLGYTNVSVVAGDGRELPEDALFDRVLLDAPCSGEGTLRRRGGRPPRQSKSFMGFVTSAQEALLRKAVRVTRPGGTILYVTCTFAPEENEAIVDAVLGDEPVAVEPLALPVPHAPGLTAFEGRSFDPTLAGAARVYPHHLDSGGLFLTRLRRLDGPPAGAPGRAVDTAWRPVPRVFPGDEFGDDGSADGQPAGPVRNVPDEAASPGSAPDVDALIAAARTCLTGDYGVDPGVLDRVAWTMRGGRLWLHTLEAWPQEGWAEGAGEWPSDEMGGPWRPITVGFRAVEFDSLGRPRPTNDLLQWLGPRITAGRVELDDAMLATVLADRRLPVVEGAAHPAGDARGLVAFAWRGAVLGRGIALDQEIVSEIPKVRARELRRVLEAADGEAASRT